MTESESDSDSESDSETVALYPPIEPHERGMLDVGDGNLIAWEVSGVSSGKPAVILHGGPGQGTTPNMRRAFDPKKYRLVLFDQRGCGKSTPNANDPSTNMDVNTTHHLIADMEALRSHLRIERWLVCGGSWGTTLALAYAEKHPDRVSEIVLIQITTSRRSETAWLYGGLSRLFPEAFERFSQVIGEHDRGDLIAAYAQLMEHPAFDVRARAARAWCAWEDAGLSLEPNLDGPLFLNSNVDEMITLVRICAHYALHGAFLEEGALIRDAGRLAKIPGVLIHGRRDLTCPIETAFELSRAWPGSKLIDLPDAGHLRSNSKRAALMNALDTFANR